MTVNTLCFAGHTVSVKFTQLCHSNTKAVIDNMSTAVFQWNYQKRLQGGPQTSLLMPDINHAVKSLAHSGYSILGSYTRIITLFLLITASKHSLLSLLQLIHHSIILNLQNTQNDLKCCCQSFCSHSTPNIQVIDSLSCTLVMDHGYYGR